MTQQDSSNPFDPFGTMKGMREAWLDAWSKTMIQMVNSEEYAKANGAMLDAWLTSSAPFRKTVETVMTQVLTQLHMPTRADVTGLAERLTNIETRLDDLEAQLRASHTSSGEGQ